MTARLEAIADCSEIEAVLVRFCRAIDRLDEPLLRSCFHDDATDDHGMFRGSASDFVTYVLESAASMIATTHRIANVTIELDGDRATSESYVHAVMRMPSGDGATDHTIHARYVDRFERRDGVWRIADRVVAYDFTRIDPVTREWSLGEAYVVGRRDGRDPSETQRQATPGQGRG